MAKGSRETATRVDPDSLESFARSLLEYAGTPEDAAAQVAESLVLADLRGHHSHGVRLLPLYLERAAPEDLTKPSTDDNFSQSSSSAYRINAAESPEVVAETDVTVSIDGRSTFGQVVGRRVVETLVEKATENGVAVVGVRDGTHIGRIGEWAERVADAGYVFSGHVNMQGGNGPVAFAGSGVQRISTNPIAFGVPTFDALEFPVVLDMATSQVAYGKIMERNAEERPVPDGWTISEDGIPVKDGGEVVRGDGAILPLGGTDAGYKGTGLALISEFFAGIIGGGTVVGEENPGYGNAAAFYAVDPLTFSTVEDVERKVSAVAEYVRSTPFSEDISAGIATAEDRTLLPGELEYRNTVENAEAGIPLRERDVALLYDWAVVFDDVTIVPDALRAVAD